MGIEAPATYQAKRSVHPEPCEVCAEKVITCPDPDEWLDVCGPVKDITYCTQCATVYSPWTMPYWRKVQAEREASRLEKQACAA